MTKVKTILTGKIREPGSNYNIRLREKTDI